jgi:putative MFS transporter
MTAEKPDIIVDERNITGRIDRLPWSRYLLAVTLVGGSAVFFDILDINTASSTLPATRVIFQMNPFQASFTIAIGFIGMFLGSFLSGYLSDKLGRKRLFTITITIMSIGSLLSAISINLPMLWLSRLITGFGIGGDFPVVWVYVSELIPSRLRGRIAGLTYVVGVASIPFIAFTTALSLSYLGNEPGWRVPYAVAAVIGVIILILRRLLPESPRYYLAHGMVDKAEQTMKFIEDWVVKNVGKPLPTPSTKGSVINLEKTPLSDLFKPGLRRRTIFSILLFIANISGFYGFNAYLPTILVQKGFTIVTSVTYSAIGYAGGIIGPAIVAAIGEKFEKRYQTIIYYIMLAILIPFFAFSFSPIQVVAEAFVINLFLQSSAVAFEYYVPEVFPTKARATGTGLANSLGRLFNAFSLLIIGALIVGVFNQLLYVSSLFILGAIFIYLIGVKTANRSLEETSERSS